MRAVGRDMDDDIGELSRRQQIGLVHSRAAQNAFFDHLGAGLTGKERQVSLDGERRVLVGDGGNVLTIPRDVVLDVLGIDAVWSGRQAVVRFTPDGASSGAVLKLSRENAEYEIRVNWYTGGVAIAP